MRKPSFALAGLIPLMTLLSGCEAPNCVRTKTEAEGASVVDAGDVQRSGVLAARLTTTDGPLPGQVVGFWVEGRMVGEDRTDARGIATLDLKGRPLKLVRSAHADSYEAAFGGDWTYCASSDEASFDIARLPSSSPSAGPTGA